MPSDTIALDPTIIGTIDRASKEVIAAERKAEIDEAERNKLKNKKKRQKARGRSSTGAEKKQRESIWDEKSRAKIKEVLDSRLKLRKLEKEKFNTETKILKDDNLLIEFDPVQVLKKIKKL